MNECVRGLFSEVSEDEPCFFFMSRVFFGELYLPYPGVHTVQSPFFTRKTGGSPKKGEKVEKTVILIKIDRCDLKTPIKMADFGERSAEQEVCK